MRILIAPDKFKGSLTGFQAAEAIAAGFGTVWPDAVVDVAVIADGGEGTAEIIASSLGGEMIEHEVAGPMGTPVTAQLAWIVESRLAVVEMSEASGYRHVAAKDRNPMRASTRGTGELMLRACELGAERIIVGLGGSATNDGGAGMAAALGFGFFDENGAQLDPVPEQLLRLARIARPPGLHLPRVIVASDVKNPLLGQNGASRTYGPQKGADAAMVEQLDATLSLLAAIVQRDLGVNVAETPGAGAAGGLGFGLLAFCGAELRPGFDLVAEFTELEARIAKADLVVTGEGSLDSQSLAGKGPAALAAIARRFGKPVIAFAGSVEDVAGLTEIFDATSSLTAGPMDLPTAMKAAPELLRRSAARAARFMEIGKKL